MRIFISYNCQNQDIVKMLIEDLETLGHVIWFDQELSGGHVWWDRVLAEIRECGLFCFILSSASIDSYACKLEFTYAADLCKIILPILVTDGVSTGLLPPALAKIQYVDYREQDKKAAYALIKALGIYPLPNRCLSPCPLAPSVPISYLGELKTEIESSAALDFQAQAALLLKLKERLGREGEVRDAQALMLKLRQRNDLLAKIAEEIDVLLPRIKEVLKNSVETHEATKSQKANLLPIDAEILHKVPVTSLASTAESSSTLSGKVILNKVSENNLTVTYNNHEILYRNSYLGIETIYYDGREVSKKWTALGGPHSFHVYEEDEVVIYELQVSWDKLAEIKAERRNHFHQRLIFSPTFP